MIKEWFYEVMINKKRYRVNCVESSGYGGSRMRTQSLTPIDEVCDEETTKISRSAKKGAKGEEDRKD